MRKDILESVQLHLMKNIKPNYSTLVKQFDCDYRTVKRYFKKGKSHGILEIAKRQTAPSLLERYESTIQDKNEIGCSSQVIFYFIHKHGYNGNYDTLNRYVKAFESKEPFELKLLQGSLFKLIGKKILNLFLANGEIFNVNIFLFVLYIQCKKNDIFMCNLTIYIEQQDFLNNISLISSIQKIPKK